MEHQATSSFTELRVWQAAHAFVLSVYSVTRHFPSEEKFGLTSQFRRAAVSIPANIAEGYKRRTLPEKLRFLNIAQASGEEVRYYLILSRDLGYRPEDGMMETLDSICRQLESYCQGIMRSQRTRQQGH
jgi:four helix bundle protein